MRKGLSSEAFERSFSSPDYSSIREAQWISLEILWLLVPNRPSSILAIHLYNSLVHIERIDRNMNPLQAFLNAGTFAVAGASRDRSKYGNQVFLALVASGRRVYPLNPTAGEVEGHAAYGALAELPVIPESLSIVTPPSITRQVIEQAIALGVKNVWMQPGAEDEQASRAARKAGLNVIDDGSCILVLLARESPQRSS